MENSDFPINCTGDVCRHDEIEFYEAVFSGSWRSPVYEGDRFIQARVLNESYGAAKQQHTFTLEVTDCSGVSPILRGARIRRKGRNIYRNGTWRKKWENENLRGVFLDEKHARGDEARAVREARKMS